MIPTRRVDAGGAAVAALLLAIAFAALWQAREFSAFGSLFPRAIGIVLLVASGAALARALSGRSPARNLSRHGLLRSALLMTTMILWIALLERAGFVASSSVGFLTLALIANRDPITVRRVATFAVLSLVIVVAFDLLFVQVLKVQLPRGTWSV